MFLPPKQPMLPPEPPWSGTVRRPLRDRIVEALRYFSDEVDSRRVGGLGEAQAAGYVAGRLRRADYAAAVQSFRAGAGDTFPLLLIAALGAIAGAIAATSLGPLWTALAGFFAVLAFALLVMEVEGRTPVRALLRGKTSQSVVAGRAAASRHWRWRVIVLAPLDGPPQMVLARRGILIVLAALAIEVVAIVGVGLLSALVWRMLAGACAALLAGVGLWVMLRRSVPALIPAVHGAGELATLLMVAEELEPLSTIEVWMVALGGGSVGNESIRALVDRYPFSPADTWVINLHNINAGQPVFVTREGVLREYRSDRALLALAADTDAADMAIDAEPRRLRQRTLAHSLLKHGFRTITISSHSDQSIFTSPDAETIERCVRLVAGMIRGLDA